MTCTGRGSGGTCLAGNSWPKYGFEFGFRKFIGFNELNGFIIAKADIGSIIFYSDTKNLTKKIQKNNYIFKHR